MAKQGAGRKYEMVLSCSICVLGAADLGRQHRGTEKRSLANVQPSHHHLRVDVYKLWISSNQGRQHDTLPDGRCGRNIGCKSNAPPSIGADPNLPFS